MTETLLSYKKLLETSSPESIARLGELPAFKPLVDKYGDDYIGKASDEELTDAFRKTPFGELEKALGIAGEINDAEKDWRNEK